jgi:hypothetical protein
MKGVRNTPSRGAAMPSRRKRKRERRLAAPGQTGAAAARRGDREDPPARGVGGSLSDPWTNASLSDLQLLRKAIRQGWPVPPERCGPILREVLAPLDAKNNSPRLLLAVVRVALDADKDNLARARVERPGQRRGDAFKTQTETGTPEGFPDAGGRGDHPAR